MDDMKGRAKEAAGDLTDNEDLKQEGKTDQLAPPSRRRPRWPRTRWTRASTT
jgi:hypothetical protein